jgi:integrase
MKAREGYVYQRKVKDKATGKVTLASPYWWVCYGFGGKTYRESSKSEVRKRAVDLLQKRLREIDEGRFTPKGERVTFETLKAVATEKAVEDGLRSLDRIEDAFLNLERHFKGLPALWIPRRVPKYIATRRDTEKASVATIRYELAVLRRAYTVAVKRRLLAFRPDFDLPKVSNTRTNFLTEETLRAIMDELPEYLRPIVEFCYLTGWRKEEALRLTWDRVEWQTKTLRLSPGTTKSGEGRSFPFGPFPRLEALIKARRAESSAWDLAHPSAKADRVFWRPTRNAAAPIQDFHETWRRACDRAKQEGAWLHDTRRSAVRSLERAGVARSVAMKLTGHKTEAVYRRYAITTAADLEEAVGRLGRVIGMSRE